MRRLLFIFVLGFLFFEKKQKKLEKKTKFMLNGSDKPSYELKETLKQKTNTG